MPRVSVIIPTYNRRRELAECLATVLAQTVEDIQVVIVDDGSTDRTSDIVAAIGDERIQYITQENGGPAKARNAGIHAATGEFIAFQDSDDLWAEDKLERQLAVFDEDQEIGWVYCDMSYFGSPESARRPNSFARVPPVEGRALEEMFVRGTPMHTPCTIVRKKCLLQTRLFDENLHAHEDVDMWLQLAARFKVAYVDASLVYCRREPQRPAKNARLALETMYLVKRRALEENPCLRENCTFQELEMGYYRNVVNLAYHFMQCGEGARARSLLRGQLDWRVNRCRYSLYYLGSYFPHSFAALRKLRQRLGKTRKTTRPRTDLASAGS